MVIKYQPYYHDSWALAVGINTYEHLSPLSYACNDAGAVATVLRDDLAFPPEHITLLTNHHATKQAILKAYMAFENIASHPDDRVLVFFAGHGLTKQGHRGDVGFLVPFDGHPKDSSTLIPWYDLTRNADLILAKHVLFIMDACYSGLGLTRGAPPGVRRFLSDMLQRRARQVIAAGKADQAVADEGGPQGSNSLFTGHLLEGLRGAAANKDGVLTASNLMHYVVEKVGKHRDSSQTPHYGYIDGDGDFVLQTPDREHLQTQPTTDFLVETAIDLSHLPASPTVTLAGPTFADKSGYADQDYPSFGRNDWTNKLGELRLRANVEQVVRDREVTRAFSWLSLIAEPISNQSISIDIATAAQNLPMLRPEGKQPYELWRMLLPKKVMTTFDSVVLFDDWDEALKLWTRYLRLDNKGNIEYATSDANVFAEFDEIRRFGYVEIIGIGWQFLFLAKRLITDARYMGGARITMNLVGTRDTILGDFAREPGEGAKKWPEPVIWPPQRDRSWRDKKCSNRNLQMKYDAVVGNLDEDEARKVINDVAKKLGLAYNHQTSPRCFNYNTDVFPWNQYFDRYR
jgi:hypothetical protein